jgi:uncharacterized membrane protein
MNLIAWALIILGTIIILSGLASILFRSEIDGVDSRRESKGIILLGPIPIVWGYGRKAWIIAAIIAITLFLIVLIWFS